MTNTTFWVALFNSDNYSFPQTWEDPTFVHPDAEGCKGDNDPVDVVEIGARIVPVGVSSLYLEHFAAACVFSIC